MRLSPATSWAILALPCLAVSGCAGFRTGELAAFAARKPADRETEPSPGIPRAHRSLNEVLAEAGELPLRVEQKQELARALENSPPTLWEPTLKAYQSLAAYQREYGAGREQHPPERYDAPQQTMAERLPEIEPWPVLQPEPVEVSPEPFVGHDPEAAPQPVVSEAEVIAAGFEQPAPATADWRESLQRAIRELEADLPVATGGSSGLTDQITLRLLYLASGRTPADLPPLADLTPEEQERLDQRLVALASSIGTPGPQPAPPSEVVPTEFVRDQEPAERPLGIPTLKFCKKVHSFGVYEEVQPAGVPRFAPGEQVLLYAEIDEVSSQSRGAEHCTHLASRYRIVSEAGSQVVRQEFGETVEYSKTSRRDYFMRYYLWLPEALAAGKYYLEIEAEDLLAGQTALARVPFVVPAQ